MSAVIKFAIIGCGRIAHRHAMNMKSNGCIVAVCDTVQEKADLLAREYGAKAYYSIDELLQQEEKPDVIAVCTPNGLHAEQSIKILESGIHVICEKPMAIVTNDCRDMIAASEKAGKNLFVVKQNRFNPPVVLAKQIIEEGKMGKIFSIQLNCFWNRDLLYYYDSWRGTQALDGGTLFTQFSHFVDLLYWMFGDVKNTKAILSNYAHKGIIEFEDTGVALLEFESGIIGTINYTVNSYKTNMEGSLTIFGEKGTLKIGGQYLNKIDYCEIENYSLPIIPEGNGSNSYGTYQGSMSNHDKVYENIKNFLQNKEPIYISSLEGSKTVEIIEKIYKNAARI